MKTLSIIIFFLFSVHLYGQTEKEIVRKRVVKGIIKIRDNFKADTNIKHLTVTLNWHRHQLYQLKLNGDYTFTFDSLNNSFGNLKITSYYYTSDTTLFLGNITPDTIYVDIPFPPVCKYDYSNSNKKCPKCKKEDKVIPIKYGYVEPNDYKNNLKNYKIGGCIVKSCQPRYYCKMDKLDF